MHTMISPRAIRNLIFCLSLIGFLGSHGFAIPGALEINEKEIAVDWEEELEAVTTRKSEIRKRTTGTHAQLSYTQYKVSNVQPVGDKVPDTLPIFLRHRSILI
jgi:hypothetical protein